MKLVIVSHTPHYRAADGNATDGGTGLVGWGATVREIDWLATLFDRVVHVAPLHRGRAPDESLPYRATNVEVLPVPPSGGRTAIARTGLLAAAPSYLRALHRALEDADAVHVRLPSNIGALAVAWLERRERPRARWYKYAGNWRPTGSDPVSFRLQRRLLAGSRRDAVVTVNGEWPDQPPHVVSFLNPCLSEAERLEAAAAATARPAPPPARLLFVGRLEAAKGIGDVAEIARRLLRERDDVEIDLVGDGDARGTIERLAATAPDRMRLHGWLPRYRLDALYRDAHLLLHPSRSEGWPKVIGEAMAHGTVPVATDVSCVGQVLARGPSGTTVDPGDVDALTGAACAYLDDPGLWRQHSAAAVRQAAGFTYEAHLDRLRDLFERTWGLRLRNDAPAPR